MINKNPEEEEEIIIITITVIIIIITSSHKTILGSMCIRIIIYRNNSIR
jgi:hypothetical protein